MISPELRLASLYHLHLQVLSLIPPALVPVRRRQVGHASQRVGMIGPEPRLENLYHLHLQVLSLLPPALVRKRRRQVSHARRCGGIVESQDTLSCLNGLLY